MNYIDLIILIFVVLYGVYGYRKGFLRIFSDFLFLFLSLFLAFILKEKVSEILIRFISLPPSILKVLSFLFLWAIFEIVFAFLGAFIYSKISEKLRASSLNRFSGIFLGVLKAIILAAVILVFIVALPFSASLKKDVLSSAFGKPLVSFLSSAEEKVNSLFGGAVNETFTLLTIKPESGESVDLKFKTSNIKVDEETENQMLILVNQERTERGLKPLIMDFNIREVARAHSADMFKDGYFAHENLKGESPFDRMEKAGIKFLVAGENLALAPNVELAHQGLMDSSGHRANILNPDFGRIGIGVQDGGIYGRMFTQNFAD